MGFDYTDLEGKEEEFGMFTKKQGLELLEKLKTLEKTIETVICWLFNIRITYIKNKRFLIMICIVSKNYFY